VAKKSVVAGGDYLKPALLLVALVGFVGWRFLSGTGITPKASTSTVSAVQPSVSPVLPLVPVSPPVSSGSSVVSEVKEFVAQETETFMDFLLKSYRPRLSVSAYSPDLGFMGNVDFYDRGTMVERYKIDALHSLGVALIHKPYGADMIYKGKVYILTAWMLPRSPDPDSNVSSEPASPVPSVSLISKL
jgi:hypothetical protein